MRVGGHTMGTPARFCCSRRSGRSSEPGCEAGTHPGWVGPRARKRTPTRAITPKRQGNVKQNRPADTRRRGGVAQIYAQRAREATRIVGMQAGIPGLLESKRTSHLYLCHSNACAWRGCLDSWLACVGTRVRVPDRRSRLRVGVLVVIPPAVGVLFVAIAREARIRARIDARSLCRSTPRRFLPLPTGLRPTQGRPRRGLL